MSMTHSTTLRPNGERRGFELKERASRRPLVALGLMSGTSLDGIDAALLTTDGERIADRGATLSIPYPAQLSERLRAIIGKKPERSCEAESRELTLAHAEVIQSLLSVAGLTARDVDVVGFHGQTIWHHAVAKETIQIGDGQWLADRLDIPVVDQFRVDDIRAGGQGAPFAPLFHTAIVRSLEKPLAVLNVGGVANVTWIAAETSDTERRLLAFDTGPGNALIDDWVKTHTGQPYDIDGQLAASGVVDEPLIKQWLQHPYFANRPPKSLDRDDFHFAVPALDGHSATDGAATLTEFTVSSVEHSLSFMPLPPRRILVCGGGRHNKTLLKLMACRLELPVEPIEVIGWDGDFIEAQAFAYLAVRSVRSLPLSVPATTGVPKPQNGGRLWVPRS